MILLRLHGPGYEILVSLAHLCSKPLPLSPVAQTQMNDVSSRSHAVFMIDILQQEKTPANPEQNPFANQEKNQYGAGWVA